MTIVTQPDARTVIIDKDGRATPLLQNFLEDISFASSILKTESFTVDNLPSAAPEGRMVFVSDEIGGAVLAFSDGIVWRRSTDRAIVSS